MRAIARDDLEGTVTVFDAVNWFLRIAHDKSALQDLQGFATDPGTLENYLDTLVDPGSDPGSPECAYRLSNEEKAALAARLSILDALTDRFRSNEERATLTALLVEAEEPGSVSQSAMFKSIIRDIAKKSILRASATHRRQTLVLAVTYMEIIIEEFLRAVFVAKPNRMHQYLSQWAEQKGKVDLKEVLDAESKEALLQSLALRSSRLAAQGKFKVIVNNIKRITGQGLDPALVEQIENLINRRNDLVHATHDLEVDLHEAGDALSAVERLAEELGEIAVTAGVPASVLSQVFQGDDVERGDADEHSEQVLREDPW